MKKLLFSFLLLGIVGAASAQTTPPDTTRPNKPDTLMNPAQNTKDSVFSQKSTSSNTAQADSVRSDSTATGTTTRNASDSATGTVVTGTGVPTGEATDKQAGSKTKTKIKTADGKEIKIKKKDGEPKKPENQ